MPRRRWWAWSCVSGSVRLVGLAFPRLSASAASVSASLDRISATSAPDTPPSAAGGGHVWEVRKATVASSFLTLGSSCNVLALSSSRSAPATWTVSAVSARTRSSSLSATSLACSASLRASCRWWVVLSPSLVLFRSLSTSASSWARSLRHRARAASSSSLSCVRSSMSSASFSDESLRSVASVCTTCVLYWSRSALRRSTSCFVSASSALRLSMTWPDCFFSSSMSAIFSLVRATSVLSARDCRPSEPLCSSSVLRCSFCSCSSLLVIFSDLSDSSMAACSPLTITTSSRALSRAASSSRHLSRSNAGRS
mmetsp:Transcript_16255/g.31228  ORF Transcript_16255/g.31228 Transcript_16255/m.31228 type:complete len:311 (+) Transcript_16255:1018-1950(+)